ncbi:hypothetical protein N7474_010253 [Penicillium riverlandense]|uniref:uncharacterized protein n=1 Tax=Penicillium riverlandense TaxID=1903569 RepID=UPI002548C37A|nr:uncharacterized protein N7474_010253 [Penicillium riverlandense]KAJ5808984.1 hypothetical protein N7474_010253 [Penicillium riverlandense]
MSLPRSSSERTGSINSQDSQKTALHTKNDPNLALYEAQPIAVNTQPATRDTVSLRSMQHKDRDGRVISDPDLSNPTRNRLERPLDTIRSFQAAIESHRRYN